MQKDNLKLKIFFIAIILSLFCFANDSHAATLYMGQSETYTNLQAAMAAMQSGDTLIIRDGVYTGVENTIDHTHLPPSGSAESGYTTIKAENMWGAVFDGQETLVNLVYVNNRSYLHFDKLLFRNTAQDILMLTNVDHIKITKCGLYETGNRDEVYSDHLFFRYADYVLVEDTAIWGNGRYHFFILDSNHVILRRCIDRYDSGVAAGYSNMGSFRIYSSSNTEVQNCISIDGDQNSHYLEHSDGGLVPAIPKTYWPGGANGPTDNVHIKGSFALNNKGMSMYILSPQWDPQNNTVENSVFWDGYNGLWSRVERAESSLFDHLTVGNIETGSEYSGIRGEYGYSIIAKNNILYSCGIASNDFALTWTDNSSNSSDYNVLYGNANNYQTNHGAHPGNHDYCTENGNEINPLSNSLKFLPRIENGSELDGAASDGGDIGATILYKIGRDGTLWGEEGYDEMTSNSLWPFPNEDLIKTKMAAYTDEGVNGARGFAASGNGLYGGPVTLTSYIWEYLGNPCPADVCNYNADENVPSFPSGLSVN